MSTKSKRFNTKPSQNMSYVLVATDRVDKSDIPIETYSSLSEAEARVTELKETHWYLDIVVDEV